MKISDYDSTDYDYADYWQGREYENAVESMAIRHLLGRHLRDRQKGGVFIDIGGSFGRLTPLYAPLFRQNIILDYSLNTLRKYRSKIQKTNKNVILIAGNLYHLPFRPGTFDGGLMMRVMHHIEEPDRYFEELARVLKPGAIFLQEFANKIHMKARIRNLLGKQPRLYDQTPYQQPHTDESSGLPGEDDPRADSDANIFLNYHPKHLRTVAQSHDLRIRNVRGLSFFRMPFLKRRIPTKLLRRLDGLLQAIPFVASLAPSMIYTLQKAMTDERVGGGDAGEGPADVSITDILVCPSCKGGLHFDADKAECRGCGKSFDKVDGIWDFRVTS